MVGLDKRRRSRHIWSLSSTFRRKIPDYGALRRSSLEVKAVFRGGHSLLKSGHCILNNSNHRRHPSRPPAAAHYGTTYHHELQASTHSAFTMTNNMNMTTMNPHRHRRSHRRRRPRSSDTTSITNDGGGSSINNANKIIAIGLVVFCFFNILDLDTLLVNHQGGTRGRRRSLLSTLYLAGPSTLLPWAHHHLVDVTDRPDPLAKNALFWRE